MENKVNHTITLENKKRMMLTGIKEVVSQVDKSVVAKTSENMVAVSGTGLRVSKLSLEEGLLVLEGQIDGFKYMPLSSGKNFFKRIFK